MDDQDLGSALILLRGLEEDPDARRSETTVRLRQTCRAVIADRIELDPEALGRFLCRLVRDTYLTEEAIEGGAGVEDICQFWHWFDQRMWPDRRPGPHVEGAVVRARPGSAPVASGTTGGQPAMR